MPGHIVLELPPTGNNPRNSEGAMLRLKDASILFAYTRYCAGSDSDEAGADVWAMRSTDEGEHFEDAGCILDHRGLGALNTMSVSLLRMRNGDIGLFFLLRKDQEDMRMHLIRSSDEGKTWTAPLCCMPEKGYYVVNNDRVVRLASGRLLIPAAWHRRARRTDGSVSFDSRSEMRSFCSDDDGLTWQEAPGKCVLPAMSVTHSGLQEPGVIEIRPGVLWGWARTDLGRQYQTFSVDDGMTWTSAEPSAFTAPLSPMCVKPLNDRQLLAVWNPVPLYNGRSERTGDDWHGGRNPLVLSLIDRERPVPGKLITVEADPDSGYCYTAIFPTKDGVLLAYCAGGRGDHLCLNRLRIRKILTKELENDECTDQNR